MGYFKKSYAAGPSAYTTSSPTMFHHGSSVLQPRSVPNTAANIPHPLATPSGQSASSNAPSAFILTSGSVGPIGSPLRKIPYSPNIFATTNQNSNAASPESTSTAVVTAPGGAASSGNVLISGSDTTGTAAHSGGTPMDPGTVLDTTPPVVSGNSDGSTSATLPDGSTVTQNADGSVAVTPSKSWALPAGLGLVGLFLLFRR